MASIVSNMDTYIGKILRHKNVRYVMLQLDGYKLSVLLTVLCEKLTLE